MKFILIAFAALAAYSQPFATHVATSTQTGVTSDKLTIQQSQTTPQRVRMVHASILSTVSGTAYVEHTSTAPTATLATISPVGPGTSASTLTAYSASDAGTGTRVSLIYPITANVPLEFDMRNVAMSGTGTTKNISIVVALGSSGNVETKAFFEAQ